jgi:hypothetical protein
MNLIMFYDFMQVLSLKRKHPTKNDYFLGIFNLLYIIYCKYRN